ncbi:hypothetical protein M569_04726 [Genlisea aurea]|uniref:Myb-like domain-containing protein n=1 Tax=Genlisea aurea TaxID=192259 RepID=S8CS24_9LAMI|nr:hypothetical protein M569_04726 [Genlisea aurea]
MDGGGGDVVREYRKGNWTVQETMVLIEAKKMDEERRMRRLEGGDGERSKPAELRWKWVEDYCWRHGCLRSQNQCNDKWDNLMRDFKKVREYEKRTNADSKRSYWMIDKNERKDNNLPSSMLPEIYEALLQAAERKIQRSVTPNLAASKSTALTPLPVQQYPNPNCQARPLLLPPPPSQQQPQSEPPFPQALPAVDSYTSDYSDSPAKRRKTGEGAGVSGGGAMEDIGSAIAKIGAMIADAIRCSDEIGEKHHREMVALHEKTLEMEESKAEMTRQGINGLADAINKLANSILALAAGNRHSPPPPPNHNH